MAGFPQLPFETGVVFDLEFTAWEGSMEHGWRRPGEFREIVQIGALKLERNSLALLEEFDVLVKPRLNPVLSAYFETLTGIGNAELAERGVDFRAAYEDFLRFAGGAPLIAFGRDDLVFARNLRLYGIAGTPPLPSYANIVHWLLENGVDARGRHACDVAPLCGATFHGQQHNALGDARSVLAGIKALVGRGARNPFLA